MAIVAFHGLEDFLVLPDMVRPRYAQQQASELSLQGSLQHHYRDLLAWLPHLYPMITIEKYKLAIYKDCDIEFTAKPNPQRPYS